MRFTTLLACALLALSSAPGCTTVPASEAGGAGGATSASITNATSTQSSASTTSSTGSPSSTASSSSSQSSSASSSGSSGVGGGAPIAGYGELSGACGEIDLADVLSPSPEILSNALDFTARPMFDESMLSPGGQQMFAEGNLGGSSLYSEIFAYEVLYRCDDATFLKGEGSIVYMTQGKKTDLLVSIDGDKVGVSVVRAVSFPKGTAYPVSQAKSVLEGKLADILQSSNNVAPQDQWKKQILAVIAQTPEHADAIVQAYPMIDASVRADTIVLVTVTEGDDDFIYYN